jgi:hypothetical protein
VFLDDLLDPLQSLVERDTKSPPACRDVTLRRLQAARVAADSIMRN